MFVSTLSDDTGNNSKDIVNIAKFNIWIFNTPKLKKHCF